MAADVTADVTTDDAIALIEAASDPAELFGADAARCYRRLARLTHPDARAGDARAARAFAKLAELWRQHQGLQGPRGPLLARGDLANLYPVRAGLLKLIRDPADNDLMDREAAALTQIRLHGQKRFGAYVPKLMQTQRIRDPKSGAVRRGNVIGRLDGFLSLAAVRAAFPGGVNPMDAAWMWRRLLVAIGAAHRAGLIHGAVLPEHVLIHPDEHGLVLIDWCYSGRGPSHQLPAIVGRYRDRYPPDVLARQPAGPDTDIWLATGCMTELTGSRLPARLAAFAGACMLANPRRRPQDAWSLLAELDEVLEHLYGARKFRPFAIPA